MRPALLGLAGWTAVLGSAAPPLPVWAALPLAGLGTAAVAWQAHNAGDRRPSYRETNR